MDELFINTDINIVFIVLIVFLLFRADRELFFSNLGYGENKEIISCFDGCRGVVCQWPGG
jgi:hypothetical protein